MSNEFGGDNCILITENVVKKFSGFIVFYSINIKHLFICPDIFAYKARHISEFQAYTRNASCRNDTMRHPR